jgi:hypothetical protein
MSPALDQYVSARYQACCLNYNRYRKVLFGDRFGIDEHLAYSLQLQPLSHEHFISSTTDRLPSHLRSYIARFDAGLTAEELNSEQFAYRMLFVPKLVGKVGQADEVVEILKADSELAKTVNRDYFAFKEVERPKHLPGEIVKLMHEDGFPKFSMHDHTELWKTKDARNPGRGLGVLIGKTWYWYDPWVEFVRSHCTEHPDHFRT